MILPNHTIIASSIMFMRYPAIILIFLKYFYQTDNIKKRVFYLSFWILLYSTIEYINLHLGFIVHHYKWNMWYSILFYFAMYDNI
ncbi:MAG: CBO0543 family protein [Bacillota bacterium]